jgi:hypothetical protein
MCSYLSMIPSYSVQFEVCMSLVRTNEFVHSSERASGPATPPLSKTLFPIFIMPFIKSRVQFSIAQGFHSISTSHKQWEMPFKDKPDRSTNASR